HCSCSDFLSVKKNRPISPLLPRKSADRPIFFQLYKKKKNGQNPEKRPNSPLTIRKSADFIFGRKIGRFSTHLWPALVLTSVKSTS
ncbi:unnamed protein product, partial [Staurois parvus]